MVERRTAAEERGSALEERGTALDSEFRPKALAKIGRGVLRMRLFWGWSQAELERRSGVDQTTISRLERGVQRGLSIRRLGKILDALAVGDELFEKPPTIPQTALEIMLYGDPWKRATDEADRRLGWPRPVEAGTLGAHPGKAVPDGPEVDAREVDAPDAWIEDAG